MSIRNQPRDAAVFGIDIGKTVFHVVGLDAAHAPIQNARFRRETLLQFFERASPVLIGMEACPGSHWLARKLQAMGHSVRIVPAQFVKPFVKSNKNDIIDAEAIAEAVARQQCASSRSGFRSRPTSRHSIGCVIGWSPIGPD